MKTANPISRFHLDILPHDYVLEVGGGHNPHPRANVVVDKYVDDHSHRTGAIKVGKHQTFLQADGCSLPFEDNAFDYVICCHVLEHVPNPTAFLKELMRVGKRGYIELPSLIGEYLAPKASHTWVGLEIDNQLMLMDKKEIGLSQPSHDFGDLFLYHLPKQSLAYRILMHTHANLMTVRYEWEQDFLYEINPADAKATGFKGRMSPAQLYAQFPQKSILQEAKAFCKALFDIGSEFLLNRLKGKERVAIDHKIGIGLTVS